jgi:hypothetical protein
MPTPEQIAERGDMKPCLGAHLRLLETARQPSPATELGKGVLDLVERRDRLESALARCGSLDLNSGVMHAGGLGQASIATIGEKIGDGGQGGQGAVDQAATGGDIVRLGRLDMSADRQAHDLDEHGPLGPDGSPTSTASLMESRAGSIAFDRLGVDHDHRRRGLATVRDSDLPGQPIHGSRSDSALSPAQPLGPDRAPGPKSLGKVAPLTAGPTEEQHRIDHLSARDYRRATSVGLEEVPHQVPLVVVEADRVCHLPRVADASDTFSIISRSVRAQSFVYRASGASSAGNLVRQSRPRRPSVAAASSVNRDLAKARP